jgi:hypothetical protein
MVVEFGAIFFFAIAKIRVTAKKARNFKKKKKKKEKSCRFSPLLLKKKMTNSTKFLFSGIDFNSMSYSRLFNYLFNLMKHFGFPVYKCPQILRDPSKDGIARNEEIFVISFWFMDWFSLTKRSIDFVPPNLVLFEAEPLRNLESKPFDRIRSKLKLVITCTPKNVTYWQDFGCKVVFLPIGYVPWEDRFDRIWNTQEKPFDACMPGYTLPRKLRIDFVREMRKQGLVCQDRMSRDEHMYHDFAQSKLFLYYPVTWKHNHFSVGRIPFAVNMGICAVGIKSDDSTLEEMYQGTYVPCNVDDIVSTCKDLVQTGKWKTLAKQNYETYKRRCDGFEFFVDSHAPAALKSFISTKNPSAVKVIDQKIRAVAKQKQEKDAK